MLRLGGNQGLGDFRDRADVVRAGITSLDTHGWPKRRVTVGVHAPRAASIAPAAVTNDPRPNPDVAGGCPAH